MTEDGKNWFTSINKPLELRDAAVLMCEVHNEEIVLASGSLTCRSCGVPILDKPLVLKCGLLTIMRYP